MPLYLTITNVSPEEWHRVFDWTPAVIGRSRECDAQTPKAYGTISRRHARIWTDHKGAWLEDLGSKGGTWIRGVRLKVGFPYSIVAGDKLRLAEVCFEVLESESLPRLIERHRERISLEEDAETASPPRTDGFAHGDVLSHAETELLVWMQRGYLSHAELGSRLHRSPNTVRTQLESIFRKTAVHSREELLKWLIRSESDEAI